MKRIIPSFLICLCFFQCYGQIDQQAIDNVVNEWNNVHNEHHPSELAKLYAPTVLFYCKELPNQECVKIKVGALAKWPSYKQTIVSKIEVTPYESGVLKCDFTKEVVVYGTPRDYESYLLLKNESGNYLIVGESDRITDNNLHYQLNLGKQIDPASYRGLPPFFTPRNIILCLFVIALLICVIVYFVKRKLKEAPTIQEPERPVNLTEDLGNKEQSKPELFSVAASNNYISDNDDVEELFTVSKPRGNPKKEVDAPPLSTVVKSANRFTENIDFDEGAKKTKEYFDSAYQQTSTVITKFFNLIDSFDRKLYGHKLKIFVWGAILVLLIPLFEPLLQGYGDSITSITTFLFFIFNSFLFFSFISSWRDDTGNWTFKRVRSKIDAYFESTKNSVEVAKSYSFDERLYQAGQFLIIAGIGFKALHNVSVLVRKLMGYVHIHLSSLSSFEYYTNYYPLISIFLGICALAYLYNQDPIILQRIKKDWLQLLGVTANGNTHYDEAKLSIKPTTIPEFVINGKTDNNFVSIGDNGKHELFNDFALAIKTWNPRNYATEYEYQDRLANHLRKMLPDATIKTEYPIGDKALGNRGRGDIVVNDTILIEMKRDSSAGAIQRAKGQIAQYSEIWKDRGIVILLLCDYDYEHARLVFSSTMMDLAKLERPVLTIVAKPKKALVL